MTRRGTLALALTGLLLTSAASADSISGKPIRVHDGDTFTIGGQSIRLHGVDAPELNQTCIRDGKEWRCGEASRDALRALIGNDALTCEVKDVDRYSRVVAVCIAVGGRDLNDAMVADGWAVAYRQYSSAYVESEARAQSSKRGIWAAQFDLPAEFRRHGTKRYAPAFQAGAPPPRCAIKGNINGKGDRIYHLPGARSYANTSIDESKGERWFCSEDDAKQAGFRPAR